MMRHFLVLLFFFFFLYRATPSPIKLEDGSSCKSCHSVDPEKINVHLIPHSHDDVGWLKTVDQYFYGSQTSIQRAGVQYIISSTVEALKADPNRRFVQVETAFFWKWWQHQPDSIKQDFVDLVNNGQLEIINAAWSMNDEAATNYQSTIDQFTYGLRTINDTIGQCGIPRIGWQIDPFGHSREQASIFAQLGYDGVFFARIDYMDRNQRIADKTMEVIWQGSANLDDVNIFTNVFPEFYYPPSGFCFDIECGDEVINDDSSSPDYNVPRRVNDFSAKMKELAQFYQTRNVLIPMGGDFQYQAAEKNYVNIDKLIEGFKDNPDINVIYSTPSCYIQAVNQEAAANDLEFVVKTDDFFPYGSDYHCFWTGYFTSRPNAKRFERQASNILQAAKQLTAFSKANGEDHEDGLTFLKQAVGILQHHDAITGTAKQAVAKDYARLLDKGVKKAEPALSTIITNLLKKDDSADVSLNLETCLTANVSLCSVTENYRFVVAVYNPLERLVTEYCRLPVPVGSYIITGPDGEVENVVTDSISNFDYLNSISQHTSPNDLLFEVTDLPGFGARLYYVERRSTLEESNIEEKPIKQQLKFGTDSTGFEIDEDTNLLKSVTMNGKTVEITQEFLYYNGWNGDNNGDENRASGAYIFRPLENEAHQISDSVTAKTISNSLVDEVHQQINDWVTQVIRVYKGDGSNYIEFDWLIGPIDVDFDNNIGKEIITRFTINDFNNEETFFTDSNGRELIKRQLNKRYDYEYNSTNEPIASNYYPVTSKILIRDDDQNLEVAVLNDRAQGGSSLANGQIELMLHRRLLKDDAKGVDEALNDTEFGQGVVARGQLYLVIGSTESDLDDAKSTAALERELALRKLLQPLVLIGDASADDLSLANVQKLFNFNLAGLNTLLPDNVHILSFEPWKDDTYLLRLEHILEKNEDATLSQTASVNLANLFADLEISEIRETTLGANQWLDEYQSQEKYQWKLKGGSTAGKAKLTPAVTIDDLEVTLEPMQIRTFVIQLSKTA